MRIAKLSLTALLSYFIAFGIGFYVYNTYYEISMYTLIQEQQPLQLQPKSLASNKSSRLYHIYYHIFQVGFHKCGARTLFHFFRKNGIPSVHNQDFDGKISSITLFERMNTLYESNLSILTNLSDKYRFYSDYGLYPSNNIIPWYRIIDKQYPNSKYIVLIRNVNHWLKSRYTHIHNGKFINEKIKAKEEKTYKNMDDMEADVMILTSWKHSWYNYLCKVFEIFHKDNPNWVI
eukprot:UN06650